MSQIKQVLRWIENAQDGATVPNLIDDFEPVGEVVLQIIDNFGYVELNDGLLTLTPFGREALEEQQ